jgi:hypothetical protein
MNVIKKAGMEEREQTGQCHLVLLNQCDKLSGSPITAGSFAQSALFGALGGATGNIGGLAEALGGLRKCMGVPGALERGEGIGTGIGTLVGTLDAATQVPYPTDRECGCSR